MKQVTVRLLQPYPTAQGLRRPQEGPIAVSEELAEQLIADKIAESTDGEPRGKARRGAAAAAAEQQAAD